MRNVFVVAALLGLVALAASARVENHEQLYREMYGDGDNFGFPGDEEPMTAIQETEDFNEQPDEEAGFDSFLEADEHAYKNMPPEYVDALLDLMDSDDQMKDWSEGDDEFNYADLDALLDEDDNTITAEQGAPEEENGEEDGEDHKTEAVFPTPPLPPPPSALTFGRTSGLFGTKMSEYRSQGPLPAPSEIYNAPPEASLNKVEEAETAAIGAKKPSGVAFEQPTNTPGYRGGAAPAEAGAEQAAPAEQAAQAEAGAEQAAK